MSRAAELSDALPNEVVARLEHLGGDGAQWLRDLPDWVDQLCSDWSLELGVVLHGGSEALVVETQAPNQPPSVLKLCVPAMAGEEDFPVAERTVLEAAGGKGYVSLLKVDSTGRALLLQRLGPPLAALETQAQRQQVHLCQALLTAWETDTDGLDLPTGAHKARWLQRFIRSLADAHPEAISERALTLALRFAQTREAAHDSARKVLVHGDPHELNLLSVPADSASDGSYLFIDPDGLYAEAEYDLGVVMRESSEALLASPTFAPLEFGAARAQRLADATGTNARAVWEWGFIERVSSGLYTHALNLREYSKPALAVASSWAEQGAADLFSDTH